MSESQSRSGQDSLAAILVHLLKGVLYRDDSLPRWQQLLRLQNRVRDYFSQIGLELSLFEEEGFAYLKNRELQEGEEEIPRLISRRKLSYTVSLTLALLRRRLAEHDTQSGEERLILDRDELVEMVRTFLPGGSNEARVSDRIERAIKQATDLGFIRPLEGRKDQLEIKRILAAFIDAEWLNSFDSNLAAYTAAAGMEETGEESDE